jgi:hypothetical protein
MTTLPVPTSDIRVAGEQSSGIGEALHHLKHSRRQSRFPQNLSQFDGGERSQLGRLEYHGVAAGQRRRRFPAGDLQRIVPGADAGDHPERLSPGVAEGLRPKIDMLAAQALCNSGEVLETIRAGSHVHH